MINLTQPSDAHRAGRFVLAVADDDGAKVGEIVQELSEDPQAFLRFALELASISIGAAEHAVGSGWRTVMSNAMLDLELTHLAAQDGPQGPEEA